MQSYNQIHYRKVLRGAFLPGDKDWENAPISMKRKIEKLILLILLVVVGTHFVAPEVLEQFNWQDVTTSVSQISELPQEILEQVKNEPDSETATNTSNSTEEQLAAFDIPTYNSEPYVVINENQPFFTETTVSCFEEYPELDDLGRCGAAYACVGIETMPTEERESISQVKPSGWNNNPYDFVDGGYVYNRCHLIGFQLTGENANEKNLVTGTRYMNVQGMLPFENKVADYVASTGNHVMYRVTPIFEGDNLVCSGVLMEAYSVEDSGAGVQFCVYCFNVQPGVSINYRTGENHEDLTYFLPEKAGQ